MGACSLSISGVLLLFLACAPPELLPESRCDGLDDNGNGLVDEGVLAARFDFGLDDAGAAGILALEPKIHRAPGLRTLHQETTTWELEQAWTESESWVWDDQDREVAYERFWWEDGREHQETFNWNRSGAVALREDHLRYVDGVLSAVIDWRMDMQGDVLRIQAHNVLHGRQLLDSRSVADGQGRLIWLEHWQLEPFPFCMEAEVHYDDAAGVVEERSRFCGEPTWDVRVERRDRLGQLLAVEKRGTVEQWYWRDAQVWRVDRSADEEVERRALVYEDRRLTQIDDEAQGIVRRLRYDDSGGLVAVADSSVDGGVWRHLELEPERMAGPQAIGEQVVWVGGAWDALSTFDYDAAGNLQHAEQRDADGRRWVTEWAYSCEGP